jgi:hypothetical protein
MGGGAWIAVAGGSLLFGLAKFLSLQANGMRKGMVFPDRSATVRSGLPTGQLRRGIPIMEHAEYQDQLGG